MGPALYLRHILWEAHCQPPDLLYSCWRTSPLPECAYSWDIGVLLSQLHLPGYSVLVGCNLLPKPWATCCLLTACHRSHPLTIIDRRLGRCWMPVLSRQLTRNSANILRYRSIHHVCWCICLLFAMLSSANAPGAETLFSRVRNKPPNPICNLCGCRQSWVPYFSFRFPLNLNQLLWAPCWHLQ